MRRLNTTFISINNIMMIIYNTESLLLLKTIRIEKKFVTYSPVNMSLSQDTIIEYNESLSLVKTTDIGTTNTKLKNERNK
jgi:hypothetical protein